MVINLTVDLKEFFCEEDEMNLSSQIKDAIAYKVKSEVLNQFGTRAFEEFSKKVKEEIEYQKESFITKVMDDLIEKSEIKSRYNSGKTVTITDWIKEEMERTSLKEGRLTEAIDKEIKKYSENISKQLKERYDILFASQIVSKLHENGMLKDDVAKLLLG